MLLEHSVVDDLTRLALDAGRGDRTAMAAFVARTQADVWRLCAHLAGHDHADDLTQDTYLRALRSLSSFEARSSARTWLLSIARRACADWVRRRVRRRRLLERVRPAPEAHPGDEGLVELGAMLAHMEAGRREAFVLTQLLGLSYAEAADVCGCPVGTIRSRVARAREELVESFGLGDKSDWAERM